MPKRKDPFANTNDRSPVQIRLPSEAWYVADDLVDEYLGRMTEQMVREGYDPIGHTSVSLPPDLTKSDDWDTNEGRRTRIRNASRTLYYRNDLAGNIINNYHFFLAGPGPTIEIPDGFSWEAGRIAALAERNHLYTQFFPTAILMTLMLGEWYAVGWGRPDYGVMDIRGVDPELVGEPELENDDPLHPLSYSIDGKDYPAERVVHFRINQGPGMHGRPILERVINRILQFEEFLLDRLALNSTRARLPLLRGIKGSKVSHPARDLPPRSTMISYNADAEQYDMPSMNINSSDAIEDARMLLLSIARGVSLIEVMVTMDARNANFTRTPVLDAIPIKLFQSYQRQLNDPIIQTIRMLADNPRLPVTVTWPEPDLRSYADKQSGAIALRQATMIDDESALEMIPGLDVQRIMRRMEKLKADIINPEVQLAGLSNNIPSALPQILPQIGPSLSSITTSTSQRESQIIPRQHDSFQDLQEIHAGLDFGYDKPGALVIVGIKGDKLIVPAEHMQAGLELTGTGNTWQTILESTLKMFPVVTIWADPANPEGIARLASAGLPIEAAPRTGRDEDAEIIDKLMQKKQIALTGNCKGLYQDLTQHEGHLYDAFRYGAIASGLWHKTQAKG